MRSNLMANIMQMWRGLRVTSLTLKFEMYKIFFQIPDPAQSSDSTLTCTSFSQEQCNLIHNTNIAFPLGNDGMTHKVAVLEKSLRNLTNILSLPLLELGYALCYPVIISRR